MIRNILQIGDPILETKSKNVETKEILSKKVQTLIDDLIDTVYSQIERSAGISAPQIGKNLRIFVARRFDLQEDENSNEKVIWEVMINPEIRVLGDEETIFWEGCLSVGTGEKALFAPVKRMKRTKITYLDRFGKKKDLGGKGFMSHIFQHEMDHLNGILFLSHVKNPENIWTNKELDEYIKENDEYPPYEE